MLSILALLIFCGLIAFIMWLWYGKQQKDDKKLSIAKNGLQQLAFNCDGGCDLGYEKCPYCYARHVLEQMENEDKRLICF